MSKILDARQIALFYEGVMIIKYHNYWHRWSCDKLWAADDTYHWFEVPFMDEKNVIENCYDVRYFLQKCSSRYV